MAGRVALPLDLLPESDVAWVDGRWLARSRAPWLSVPGLERSQGRWVRLRYHAGLHDPHVRPLIRFAGAGGVQVEPMNGALMGVGEWVGRVPDSTQSVEISPVDRPGPFSFALVAARSVSRLALLARGLLRQPRLAVTACAARVIGARREARHCLAFAALGTSIDHYDRWRATRTRAIEQDDFDRPHGDPAALPPVHLLLAPEVDGDAARASLALQHHPDCRVHGPGSTDVIPAGAICVRLGAGDALLPEALALAADHLASHPDLDGCFGDEELLLPSGEKRLLLRTDREIPPAGALFRRVRVPGTPAEVSLAPLPARIGHLRRVLLRRAVPLSRTPLAVRPSSPAPVTAIIPTRDRAALLAACLEGLGAATDHGALDIVIVDNGTTAPDALAVIAAAAARPGVTVLRSPGPFNYAALCNAGATAAHTPLLLFLNNDVVPVAAGWIERLAAWALQPDVGAVGARLLYPDGRLQHGGVAIGMGGTALHLDHRARTPGDLLGDPEGARSVGAVTGAVLMVEQAKFAAVGGFDAEAFPVLLNDVDLCLRLAARGWRTIYEPAVTLIHAESASRGRSARPFTLYGAERRRFTERWAQVIRDDPDFHPALSLTSLAPALG